jgi:hypothetical protein
MDRPRTDLALHDTNDSDLTTEDVCVHASEGDLHGDRLYRCTRYVTSYPLDNRERGTLLRGHIETNIQLTQSHLAIFSFRSIQSTTKRT